MSIFASPIKAPRPKTKNIIPISLFLAGFFALLAVMQLFQYEDFPTRLAEIGAPLSFAPLLAAVIVIFEVLALPWALRLSLSPTFRILSMASGWLVAVALLLIAIVENFTASAKLDAVFGATLPLPVGAWSICAALALCVLVGWTSWGLWPFRSKK